MPHYAGAEAGIKRFQVRNILRYNAYMKKISLKISYICLLGLLLPLTQYAQKSPFILGDRIQYSSELFQETRELLIYLPQDYAASKASYPVLYILDGEWHFIHTSGIVQFLSRPRVEKIPEMIVVGVTNTRRGRDFSPGNWPGYSSYTGGADDFKKFLNQELFPFVTANYRINNYKILAGHSLAGTFSLYTFLTEPEIFDAYIALSPCLFWHDQLMQKKTTAFFRDYKILNKKLYIAHEYSSGEPAVTMQDFQRQLKSQTPAELSWQCHFMEHDDHFSYVHTALFQGLIFIFSQ